MSMVGVPSRLKTYGDSLGVTSRPAPAWRYLPARVPKVSVTTARARYAPYGPSSCVDADGRGVVPLGRAAFMRSVPARLRPLVERHQHVHTRVVSARMRPTRGAVSATAVAVSPKPRVLAGARKPAPPAVGLVSASGHRTALALVDWALVEETAPSGAWWVDTERGMAWCVQGARPAAAAMLLRGVPDIPEALCAALEMQVPDEECVWAWAAHELEKMVPRREGAKARAAAKEKAVRAFLRSDEFALGETMPRNRYPVDRLDRMARGKE